MQADQKPRFNWLTVLLALPAMIGIVLGAIWGRPAMRIFVVIWGGAWIVGLITYAAIREGRAYQRRRRERQ